MEKNIKKKYIYVYSWVTLLYSGNEHNIVNQVYFNKNKFKNPLASWVTLLLSLAKVLGPFPILSLFPHFLEGKGKPESQRKWAWRSPPEAPTQGPLKDCRLRGWVGRGQMARKLLLQCHTPFALEKHHP